MDAEEALSIGARARRIRQRRGLSLEVVAGLAGITAPYLSIPAVDRQSAVVTAAVTEISTALHDVTLEDVPDILARPMAQLTSAAALAHACADDASYGLAAQGLAALLVELQVQAVTGDSDTRRAALTALVEACKVAYILAKRTGRIELAGIAAQ